MAKKEDKIIEIAVKRLDKAIKADEHNRKSGIEDLKFSNGEQWDAAEMARRELANRPALQINLLHKFIDQVVGDMLQNTPAIKIHPVDSKSDMVIAQIRQGIINNIEYNSNSKGIYNYAGKQMVAGAYGAWRVLTRYTEENPFLQEIYMEGIRNPYLVYMDPSSKDQNYADANWGFLLEKIPVEDFKERYPNVDVPGDEFKTGEGLQFEHWFDEETVTVAEYFEKAKIKVTMHQLEDGRVVTEDEYKDIIEDWEEDFQETLNSIENPLEVNPSPTMGEMPQEGPGMPPISPTGMPGAQQPTQMPLEMGPIPQPTKELTKKPKIAKTRETDKIVIHHRIITCNSIIEGGTEGEIVPGKYIPLVLLKGKELNIEGKNFVYSLIRPAKDPQKLFNYWNTSAAETIALAPKAPWVGTAKQFEGYEEDYSSANIENFAFLKYNPDPEAPGPPQRQGAGNPPVAIFEQIRRMEENVKSVLGMFNSDVGAPGSEQTGAAITARQRPGDIATYEFMENLARAILFTGRIINEMIPDVYDSERDVRIRNMDDSDSFVPVNTTVGTAMKMVTEAPEKFKGMDPEELRSLFSKEGKDAKYNDITVGKYDVVVTTGPSYATQRQEASQHLMTLTQAMPQQMGIALDLIVENMDFKGAEELASRLRKGLPPGMVKPREGEQPPAPPQPNPEVLMAQAKLEGEKIKSDVLKSRMQLEQMKLQKESQQVQIDGPTPAEMQLEQMKLEMEKIRGITEKNRLASEKEAADLRAQIERERLQFQNTQQELSIMYQREAHVAKMQELEQKQKDPLNIRKSKKVPEIGL